MQGSERRRPTAPYGGPRRWGRLQPREGLAVDCFVVAKGSLDLMVQSREAQPKPVGVDVIGVGGRSASDTSTTAQQAPRQRHR